MSGSCRSIIAAAGLACLLIVFGIGLFIGTLNYPDEKRHQEYRYTDKDITDTKIAARPDLANAKEYKAPCDKPYGKDESDLCAQWRAAKAAENSALWTKWGVWIAVIGSSLLLWQIMLTREAVKDTGDATIAMQEANEISRHALESQQRPVITVGPIDVNIENFLKGSFTIENIGLGIARIIKCTAFTTRTPRQGEIDMPMTKVVEVQNPVRIITSGLLVSQGRNRCEFGVGTMRHLERQCIKTRIVLEYANAVGEKTTMFTSEVCGEFRPVTESEGSRGMYMGDRVIPNIVDAVFDIDQTTWKMT